MTASVLRRRRRHAVIVRIHTSSNSQACTLAFSSFPGARNPVAVTGRGACPHERLAGAVRTLSRRPRLFVVRGRRPAFDRCALLLATKRVVLQACRPAGASTPFTLRTVGRDRTARLLRRQRPPCEPLAGTHPGRWPSASYVPIGQRGLPSVGSSSLRKQHHARPGLGVGACELSLRAQRIHARHARSPTDGRLSCGCQW
jgi:hypothetical protein